MKDIMNAKTHLREHATYPATKAELEALCDGMSDFSEEDKKEFSAKLPEGSYKSADEVITAMGW